MNSEYRQFLREGEQAASRYALTSPRRLPRGMSGNILGSGAGSSLEFLDHREYQPGDDLRHIDWSAYARTDKLIVKLFREEISPHCDILIDGSCSMALAETQKARSTVALSALLGQAAQNADCSCRAWFVTDQVRPLPNGHERPSLWEGLDFRFPGNPGESMLRQPPECKPHGIRILVSDLFWAIDPLPLLQRLAEKAAALFVVQILAQSDLGPTERGNIRLIDSETGLEKEIFLDDPTIQAYRDSLQRLQHNWNRSCSQVGARMVTVIAESLLQTWDLQELVSGELLKVG
ncbi:MAG TPA: DUF58 domain-containing protein [Candidatus Ozemobacteraceae bacterium]|nr:DUF58 domain-containing protein [Candidatus Ozemobacteraceae bacterium]